MAKGIVRAADRDAIWREADVVPHAPGIDDDDEWEQQLLAQPSPPPKASSPPQGVEQKPAPNSNKFKTPANGLKKVLENDVDFMPAPKHQHPAVKAWTDSKPDFAKTYFKPEYQDALKGHLGPDNYNKLVHHMPQEHHDALHNPQQAPVPKNNKFTQPASALKKLLDTPHTETTHVTDWLDKHPGFQKTYMAPKYQDALKGHLGDKAYNELQEHLKAAQQPAQGQHGGYTGPQPPANALKPGQEGMLHTWMKENPGWKPPKTQNELSATPPKKPTKKWVGEGPEPGLEPADLGYGDEAYNQGDSDVHPAVQELGAMQGWNPSGKWVGMPEKDVKDALKTWKNTFNQAGNTDKSQQIQRVLDKHFPEGLAPEDDTPEKQYSSDPLHKDLKKIWPNATSFGINALQHDPEADKATLKKLMEGWKDKQPELQGIYDKHFGDQDEIDEIKSQQSQKSFGEAVHDLFPTLISKEKALTYNEKTPEEQQKLVQNTINGKVGDHPDLWDGLNKIHNDFFGEDAYNPHPVKADIAQQMAENHGSNYNYKGWLDSLNNDELKEYKNSPQDAKEAFDNYMSDMGYDDDDEYYEDEFEDPYDDEDYEEEEPEEDDEQTTSVPYYDTHGLVNDYKKAFPNSTYGINELGTPDKAKNILQDIINEPEEEGLGNPNNRDEYASPQEYEEHYDQWMADKLKAQQLYDKHFGDGEEQQPVASGGHAKALQVAQGIQALDPKTFDDEWVHNWAELNADDPEEQKNTLNSLIRGDWSPEETKGYQALLDKHFGEGDERQPQSLGQKMQVINPSVNAEVFDKQSPEGQKDILQNVWAKDSIHGPAFQQLYNEHFGEEGGEVNNPPGDLTSKDLGALFDHIHSGPESWPGQKAEWIDTLQNNHPNDLTEYVKKQYSSAWGKLQNSLEQQQTPTNPFQNSADQWQILANGIDEIFPKNKLPMSSMSVDELKQQLEQWQEHLADTPGHAENLNKIKALYDQVFGDGDIDAIKGQMPNVADAINDATGGNMVDAVSWGKQTPEQQKQSLQALIKGYSGDTKMALQDIYDDHFGAQPSGKPPGLQAFIDHHSGPGQVWGPDNPGWIDQWNKLSPEEQQRFVGQEQQQSGPDLQALEKDLNEAFGGTAAASWMVNPDKIPEYLNGVALGGGEAGALAKKLQQKYYGDEPQGLGDKLKDLLTHPTPDAIKAWNEMDPEQAKQMLTTIQTSSAVSPELQAKAKELLQTHDFGAQQQQVPAQKGGPNLNMMSEEIGSLGGSLAPLAQQIKNSSPGVVKLLLQQQINKTKGTSLGQYLQDIYDDHFGENEEIPQSHKDHAQILDAYGEPSEDFMQWFAKDNSWNWGENPGQDKDLLTMLHDPENHWTQQKVNKYLKNQKNLKNEPASPDDLVKLESIYDHMHSGVEPWDGHKDDWINSVVEQYGAGALNYVKSQYPSAYKKWQQSGEQAGGGPDLAREMANNGNLSFLADGFQGKSFPEQMELLKQKIDTPGALGTQNKPLAEELYKKYQSQLAFQAWFAQTSHMTEEQAKHEWAKIGPHGIANWSPGGGNYEKYGPGEGQQPTFNLDALNQGIKDIYGGGAWQWGHNDDPEAIKKELEGEEWLADPLDKPEKLQALQKLYDAQFGGKPSSEQYTGAEPLSVEELTKGLDWGDKKLIPSAAWANANSDEEEPWQDHELMNLPDNGSLMTKWNKLSPEEQQQWAQNSSDQDEISQIKQQMPGQQGSGVKAGPHAPSDMVASDGTLTPQALKYLQAAGWQTSSLTKWTPASWNIALKHGPGHDNEYSHGWDQFKQENEGQESGSAPDVMGEIAKVFPAMALGTKNKWFKMSPEDQKAMVAQHASGKGISGGKMTSATTKKWKALYDTLYDNQAQTGGYNQQELVDSLQEILPDLYGNDAGFIDQAKGKSEKWQKSNLKALIEQGEKQEVWMPPGAVSKLKDLYDKQFGDQVAQKPQFDLQSNGVPTAKQLEAWGLPSKQAIGVSSQSPETFKQIWDHVKKTPAGYEDGPWGKIYDALKDHDWPLQGGSSSSTGPVDPSQVAKEFNAIWGGDANYSANQITKATTPKQVGQLLQDSIKNNQGKPEAAEMQKLYDKYFGNGGAQSFSSQIADTDQNIFESEVSMNYLEGGYEANPPYKWAPGAQAWLAEQGVTTPKDVNYSKLQPLSNEWEGLSQEEKQHYIDTESGKAGTSHAGPPQWDPKSFAEQYKQILPGSSSSLAGGSVDPQKAYSKLTDLISAHPDSDKTPGLQKMLDHWFPDGAPEAAPAPGQPKKPPLPAGSAPYKALMKNVLNKPQGMYSEADMKTLRSKAFQQWFDAAPQGYKKTLATNPGIVIDDFDAGNYSAPVGGGDWDSQSHGGDKYYDVMGYPKTKNNEDLPEHLRQNPSRPGGEGIKFPRHEDEQEPLPLPQGEHFAPHYAPMPIYRLFPIELDKEPSVPHWVKGEKEKALFREQQKARLRRIDEIINGTNKARNTESDTSSFNQWTKSMGLSNQEKTDLYHSLFAPVNGHPTLLNDDRWKLFENKAKELGIAPEKLADLAENLDIMPNTSPKGNYDHPDLANLILDYAQGYKGHTGRGGLGTHWTRDKHKVYQGVGGVQSASPSSSRRLTVGISGLWSGQGEDTEGSHGAFDPMDDSEREHTLEAGAPVWVRRLQIKDPNATWHDLMDHGPISTWTPGRDETAAKGVTVRDKPSLAEELDQAIGGSHDAEVFDKLKPGHKADMLLGKIWKDNPGKRDKIEELYRDFFVGRPDLPTKPHKRSASLQRAPRAPVVARKRKGILSQSEMRV